MPANTPVAGYQMHLYRASIGSDSWVLIGAVQDLTIDNMSRGTYTLAHRGDPWKRNMPLQMEPMEVSFKLVHNIDQSEAILRGDYTNGTPAQYAMVNGPIDEAGTQGWSFPAYVIQFNRDESLDSAVTNDVKLTLGHVMNGSSLISPTWLTVAAATETNTQGSDGTNTQTGDGTNAPVTPTTTETVEPEGDDNTTTNP